MSNGEQVNLFLEFFAANVRNPHTRRHTAAGAEFLEWCADAGVAPLGHVAPLHAATWMANHASTRTTQLYDRRAKSN